MTDQDLERFSSLLEITISTARNAKSMFSSMQQTLEFVKTYSKDTLDTKFSELDEQLLQTYKSLCTATDAIDQLNHDINGLIQTEEPKPPAREY